MCHNSLVEAEGRKLMLNRVAIAVLLLGLQVAVAVADDPPKLNVTTSCDAAAKYSVVAGRDNESCLGDEREAQSTLAKNWSKYIAADKTQCVGTVTTGGPPSYVELLSCLEVMRDAKNIREGNALEQPDRPAQSKGPLIPRRRR
jgi:hypothetical protein